MFVFLAIGEKDLGLARMYCDTTCKIVNNKV